MYTSVCNEDLQKALDFFNVLEEGEGIVVQCNSINDMPYIKHNIRKVLGEPDRSVSDTLYYHRRRIIVMPIGREDLEGRGDIEDQSFFVSVGDNPHQECIVNEDLISLWITLNVSAIDIQCILEEHEYSPECICNHLKAWKEVS